jgi:hypothetical protein
VTLAHRCRFALPLLLALAASLAFGSAAFAQVVIPPIAPPKPAVQRNANALIISTGDLNEALNFARQSLAADAKVSFNLFKEDWAAEADAVREQSDDIADAVDDAVAQAQAVFDSDASDGYFAALQSLADAVEEANNQLALIAPASAALRIGNTDLNQAVTWASQGNLPKVHDEFDQFRDEWSLVRNSVRQQAPVLADGVDAATNAVVALVSNPANPNPSQADYYPALQALQQLVANVNTQLAVVAAPVAAPGAPLRIRPGNLGESVDAAQDGDLAEALKEYGEFKSDYLRLQDQVRQRATSAADSIEAAIATADAAFAASPPVQADYVAALEDLQRAVEDANAQLGN